MHSTERLINVALVTGGYTEEASVSVRSAAFVAEHLDPNRYRVFLIHLSPESWFYESDSGKRYEVDRKDFSLGLESGHTRFDVAFIMVHGSPGEDGLLQGYF